ncbi:hypothetical protein Tco_1269445, partial [Tanacetum coccineum]
TPPYDLIEEVAHTIVSTIPAKKSDTEQEKDQNTNAGTAAEPKASSAKRLLLSELSSSTKKKERRLNGIKTDTRTSHGQHSSTFLSTNNTYHTHPEIKTHFNTLKINM